jgi:hypothetical protein
MFNQVYENFREATEATVQMQQEVFKTWAKLWPGMSATTPAWSEQAQQFQKKWAETVGDMIKLHREVIETHFKAGAENIEKAFQIAEAKTTEELRTKSMELWQKTLEDLRKVCEAQLRGFEAVVEKWAEFTTKVADFATKAAA